MAAAGHHLNLAQGRALTALRAQGGSVRAGHGDEPAAGAARRKTSPPTAKPREIWDAAWNRAYLDPLFRGTYPARYLPLVEKLMQPATWCRSARRSTFSASITMRRCIMRDRPERTSRHQLGRDADRDANDRLWAGAIDPTGLTEILVDLRRPLRQPARLHHREWRIFYRGAGTLRPHRRPRADSLPPRSYGGGSPRDRGGRKSRRLFHLDAGRQLGMGARFFCDIWTGPASTALL